MQFDFASMAILIAINLAVIGTVLPFVMGSPVSTAAQHAQRYFLLQATGWALILVASRVRGSTWDPVLSLAATMAASAGQWQMAQALQGWLGPRPLRRVVATLCVLGPLGFALFIGDIPWRLSWYSACHATVIACLGWMCLKPLRPAASSWRYVVVACAVIMSLSLFTRAYLVACTPWLNEFAQNNLPNQIFAIIAQMCSSMYLVGMLVAWRDETNQKLRDLAMTDQLTGLSNRHALLQAAQQMLALAKRQQQPLAVVMIDLDHFKSVNDLHGHATGDKALQLMALVLQSQMRSDEMAARWGGEEFCLLMYAQAPAVQCFFDRLSAAVCARAQQEIGFPLHLSAGCALQDPEHPNTLEQLLQQADAALYQAKSHGRAQLAFAPIPPAATTSTPDTLGSATDSHS